VTTTVRDSSQLLHVDMHELTAAAGLDPTDHTARRTIHPSEPVHAVTDQDPMHRRGRDTHDAREASWAELAGLT